ncbi:MAG: cbb3-type cytochrome c oxidase subunit I [Anaerolineae bacterium]|nr:cbb3-type cytochrome c oxidase subunit I [Anaerolineae bacterium]
MSNNSAMMHGNTSEENGIEDLYDDYTAKSWLLTFDHRRLAILYFGSILFFLLLGGLAATVLRLELLTPAADLLSGSAFKKIYTFQGLGLIFFGLVPLMPAVFGNFLVPAMIGSPRMALPRLNLLSWYLYLLAGALLLFAGVLGGVETGWTLDVYYGENHALLPFTLTALSIIVVSFASILLAVNLITTTHAMRASEITWSKLPLFVWSIYIASLMALIGTPVLVVAVLLLLTETWLNVGIFAPQMGGDPILYQHLFWFYGNQITFAIGLPAVGIILEIVATFARRPIFGRTLIPAALAAIGYLAIVSWGVQIFPADLSGPMALLSSFFSMLMSLPITMIGVSIALTFYKADLKFDSPMWFVFGSLGLILISVSSGLILSVLALSDQLYNTYFVAAHVNYAITAVLMAGLAGLHFWWATLTGRTYPEGLAKLAACIVFVGANLAFFVQFIVGYLGMPQDVQSYPANYLVWQIASTLGGSIMLIGTVLMGAYLLWSVVFNRQPAGNPWQATGLVWKGR